MGKNITDSPLTLAGADKIFATPSRLQAVAEILNNPEIKHVSFCGLAGSASAMLLAAVNTPTLPPGKSRSSHLWLIVADDAEEAGYVYNDLCHIVGEDSVAIFPSGYKRDIKYGQPDPPAQILRTETLNAINSSTTLRWIVSSPEGLAEKVPAKKRVKENTTELRTGMTLSPPTLKETLLRLGFNRTDYVYEPGQFAQRGSIFDIFSYNNELPYRIDFFDDEIDSIRIFNVETQLSEKRVEKMWIAANNSDDSNGISLLEYLGKDVTVAATSPTTVCDRVAEIVNREASKSIAISGEGDINVMQNAVDHADFAKLWNKLRIIHLSQAPKEALSTSVNPFSPQAIIDFKCTPQTLYHKNFDLIADSFSSFINEGYEILILSDSPWQADRLRSIFEDRKDNIIFRPVDKTLHAGFVDTISKTCFFTDHQIFDRFHKYNLRSDKARSGKLALSLKELNQIEPGDYIVHVDHGIGKFAGLIKTPVNGTMQEMIKLVYKNDDIILVSIHNLHKLSKYRGKEGIPPKINRIGGSAWDKLKDRTKSKLKDIARDLIKLYAARREEKGFSFSPDSFMQHELEASFIYEDTPDQINATQAIKADMESARPMDRLICGDVGFGKTELAVRAAFKAAADNKQTALLVPTTVLAMQHYNTFRKRLKDMPVRVEVLSRARKPKDVKQILTDLADGKIDILVGTHKIIGKNVKFKDLGLLIIDEEQKFGVAVKEKLKQLKTNVDTLTMSATPIPRTLQFSLMGARDLSSLNTPPANRHPVVTSVVPWADDTISEAINFELSRNGQVFFISNRIERLHQIKESLERLTPGARVVVAHGQMPPETLEKAIVDFTAHDYDVLLATTIVENGIDIGNVNTILVDNAQNFGLSELHQLRGRVGRSSRKAFCYLLVPPALPLTPVARRRLQAIESFSDLGSGIHIAMQDLDIRGAGNLLGAEQSGFIADLGYETYQKILREAVVELKTEEFGDTFTDTNAGKEDEYTADCTIDSDMELRLPAEYVPQEATRIGLYQQLDNLQSDEAISQFRKHLSDRFGTIPQVTEELIKIVPLRLRARRLGIERVLLKNGVMRLYFVGDNNKAYYQSEAFSRVITFLQNHPERCRIREKNNTRSIVIDNIKSVNDALNVLNEMLA